MKRFLFLIAIIFLLAQSVLAQKQSGGLVNVANTRISATDMPLSTSSVATTTLSTIEPQEPTPITVSENTATETVTTYTEYTLRKLTVEISPQGFLNTRITIVAGLGKTLTTTDPLTGYKLFESARDLQGNPIEVEIFSGQLSAYLEILEAAKTATLLTEEQKQAIIAGQLAIYNNSFDGFKTTVNLLIALGKLELKAKKIAR